ncbi:hypothetical protein HYV44_00310 [Candidatus Microgenomates bacterium]|nr:hypothetical protein [Candidatus Microgenomates bacterium]
MPEENQYVTKKELSETLTEKLGEFAEDVLLPAVENMVERIVDEKTQGLKTELKDYTDRRVGKAEGEIISMIDRKIDAKVSASEEKIISVIDKKISASEEKIISVIDKKIDAKVSASEEKIISVIDKKIDAKVSASEEKIISAIRGEEERHNAFHAKTVEIFAKKKLADEKELDYLTALVK